MNLVFEMNEKLTEKLKKKYPKLFKLLNEYNENSGKYMPIEAFGIECNDGWYPLIDNICSGIKKICLKNNVKIPVVHQIKEKFGGLRFYIGTVNKKVSKEVFDIIHKGEKVSYNICENCGTKDNVELYNKGYIKVRCEDCYEEEKNGDFDVK